MWDLRRPGSSTPPFPCRPGHAARSKVQLTIPGPPQRRYSRIYHKKHELIDHILVNHELIFRQQKVDSYVEPIESIGEGTEIRQKAVFPDHAPLFAQFEIPELSTVENSTHPS